MAKSLKDILAGSNASKVETPDLTNLTMSPEGNKDGIKFAAKHKIQKHADRAGNGDDIYQATNIKTANYNKQDQKVYESLEEKSKGKKKAVQDGRDFYDQKSGKRVASYGKEVVKNDSDVEGAKKAREHFNKNHKTHFVEEVEELDEKHSYYASNIGGRVKMHAPGTMLKHEKHGTVSVVSSDPGHKDFDASSDSNPKGMKGPSYKVKDGKGQTHHIDLESDWGLSDKPIKPKRINVKEEVEELDEKYMGFKKLVKSIAAKGDVRDPEAVAASIGRKKYGKEKFQKAAAADKKLKESSCNHTNEGTYCEMHGKETCPSDNEKGEKEKKKGKKLLLDKNKCNYEEVQYIEEKLTGKDPASKWIHDFVNSDNPMFKGKSTKERQQMALGAYYKAKRGYTKNEQTNPATNTDYAGPGAAGWTTGRLDTGTL